MWAISVRNSSPQGIVAAIVRIFQVVPVPVVRIARIVVWPPEFQAMDPVPQKRIVHVDQPHVFVLLGRARQ